MASVVLAAQHPLGSTRAMLAPLWRGIEEVTLACESDESGLCAAALAEARRGSPYPVRAADGSGGFSTMALRLTVGAEDGAPILTIDGGRAESFDDSQGALRPRVTRAAPGEPLARTLVRAFDGALPWRRVRAPLGPIRPIH